MYDYLLNNWLEILGTLTGMVYLYLEYKGNKWFDGLKVNSHPEVEEHRNAYPVIRLCMKDLVADDVEGFNGRLKLMLKSVYRGFKYLRTRCPNPSATCISGRIRCISRMRGPWIPYLHCARCWNSITG